MDRVNGYYWKIFEDFNKFGKVFLVVGVFGVVGCYEDVFFGFKVKFFEDVVFFFCYQGVLEYGVNYCIFYNIDVFCYVFLFEVFFGFFGWREQDFVCMVSQDFVYFFGYCLIKVFQFSFNVGDGYFQFYVCQSICQNGVGVVLY